MSPLRFGFAATDADDAVADSEDGFDPISLACRVRVLAMVALGPLITGYAAVAAILALVTAVASKAHFSTAGVLSSALPGWLAAHQVPLKIEGHELGALPLLPAIAAVVLLARTASGAVQRLDLYTPRQAGQVVAAIAGGHAVFGLILGLLCTEGPATVDPLAAFYYPGLLAAAASVAGVARYGGLLDLALERMDAVAMRGLWVGLLAVVALLAAGAFVLSLGLVTSVGTVREMFADNAPGFGSGLGMLLLSAGYLPNGVIAGTSFVAGSGFALGEISVGPLNFAGGPVPGLPLLAALPEEPAAWWPLLLALPIGIGVLVGRLLRDVAEEPMARLRAVAVATGVVALSFVILAGSAGGPLGGGPFDPVDLRAASLSVALVAWVGLVGAAVVWFAGARAALDGPSGLLEDDDLEDAEEPDDPQEPEEPEEEPEEPEEPAESEEPAEDEPGEEPAPADVDTEAGDDESADLPDKID